MSEWHLASAESQGVGHQKSDTPCQDKTYCMELDDVSVIALADGAGSAKLSHFGAETVVEAISDLLTNDFDRLYADKEADVAGVILATLLEVLDAKASELDCQTPHLASTLLAVAVKKGRYIAVHIGDGVIGGLGNTTVEVISEPDNGELANETKFVTSADAAGRIRLYRNQAKKYSGFVLMSDGSAHSLYDKRERALTKAVTKLFFACKNETGERMSELLSEMLDEQLTKRTADDCSIAIMARDRGKLNKLHAQLYGAAS